VSCQYWISTCIRHQNPSNSKNIFWCFINFRIELYNIMSNEKLIYSMSFQLYRFLWTLDPKLMRAMNLRQIEGSSKLEHCLWGSINMCLTCVPLLHIVICNIPKIIVFNFTFELCNSLYLKMCNYLIKLYVS
jgi:hypothetical protein